MLSRGATEVMVEVGAEVLEAAATAAASAAAVAAAVKALVVMEMAEVGAAEMVPEVLVVHQSS